MSLNDFDGVDPVTGDVPVLDLQNVLSKRKIVDAAIGDAYDAATEIGFKLGSMDERARIVELLDVFIEGLEDSEEIAKKTLAIFRDVVLQSEEDTDERRENVQEMGPE